MIAGREDTAMPARFRHASYVVRWRLTNANSRNQYDWVLDQRGAGIIVGWQNILDHLSAEGWELVSVAMASWELEHVLGEGIAPKFADAYRLFVKQPA
jgi:hypothetical protein